MLINFERRNLPAYAVCICAGLIIGFFGGREYLKYEIRRTFTSAAEQLHEGLKDIFADGPGKMPMRPALPSPSGASASGPMPVTALLTRKGFHDANPQSFEYQDYITISLAFENVSGKDIRAFEGVLRFFDLLDNEILSTRLVINDSVKASAKMAWDGTIDYNQFRAPHQRLRGEPQQNLKTRFEVTKVLFSDGTTRNYD